LKKKKHSLEVAKAITARNQSTRWKKQNLSLVQVRVLAGRSSTYSHWKKPKPSMEEARALAEEAILLAGNDKSLA
jgi:hypothetical protein